MRGGDYYLAYQPPGNYDERRRLVRELNALGAVRLHYSLWRISPKNAKPILPLLKGRRPIVLKRSRGIVAPSVSSENGTADIGTVAVIAYRLPRLPSRNRAALSRALNGVPAMKIGRCLYLVPHLKASRIAAYKGTFLTSYELFTLLGEQGIHVSRLAHLRVVYPTNQEPLLRAYVEEQADKIERLILACRRLKESTRTCRTHDPTKLRKLLSAYRRRYKSLKGIAIFLHRELGINIRPVLKRAYVALMSCRVLLESQSQA